MGSSGAIGESWGLSDGRGPDGRVITQLDVRGSAIATVTLQPEALLPFR
jgi:hypothetical protein